MMQELIAGPLGLLLAIAVLWWGITFNSRLEERYHCTACTFGGVAGGVAATFCWMLAWTNPLSLETVLVGVAALTLTLGLFFSNRAKSGSAMQGIWMTVWQLFVGLVVFGILAMLDSGKKRRKR